MNEIDHEHPSGQRLVGFVAGTLSDQQIAAVERHLEDCETCLHAVETLPEDRMVRILRGEADAATDEEEDESPNASPATSTPRADGIAEPVQVSVPAGLVDHPRYRILEQLGSGGMGTVFLAEHLHLRRKVALKVVRADLLDDVKAVDRFRGEVKAAGRLSHPNIVTTYDADRAGETWFLVTEWVPGAALNRVVAQRGPLPISLACQCAQQAALGLQHAFEQGIIHRDIKPHNLLLAPDGTTKILDFGLSRFVSEWDPEGSLTDFGTGLGTPDYVAPEQARNARAADIRADIYSLGCTLYFLLAGRAPFPHGSASEKVLSHLARDPESLGDLRGDIPPGLVRIIQRMMAKEAGQRYQTPAEVAAALEPYVGPYSAPDAGAIAGASPPTGMWPSRRRMTLLLAAAVAGVAALGAIAVWVIQLGGLPGTGTGNGPPGTAGDQSSAVSSRQVAVLRGHTDLVRSVAVSSDGRHLASGGLGGTVRLWDVSNHREVSLFTHDSPVLCVAFSPSGTHLLFCGGNSVLVADVKTGKTARRMYVSHQQFNAAVFVPDSRRVLSADLDGLVRTWDSEDGRQVAEFKTDVLPYATFSRDGRHVLFSSGGRKATFCDIQAGKTVCRLEGHSGKVRCVALSTKAQQALTGGDDETIRLWSLPAGQELCRMTGHEGAVRCVAFSPDDTMALSGGDDGTVRLWDLANGNQIMRLDGHQGAVWSVTFFPNSQTAASGGADKTVRLWDLRK